MRKNPELTSSDFQILDSLRFSPFSPLCSLCLCGKKRVHFRPFFLIFSIGFNCQSTTSTEILTVSFSSRIFFNKVSPDEKGKRRKQGCSVEPASLRVASVLSTINSLPPAIFGAVWN